MRSIIIFQNFLKTWQEDVKNTAPPVWWQRPSSFQEFLFFPFFGWPTQSYKKCKKTTPAFLIPHSTQQRSQTSSQKSTAEILPWSLKILGIVVASAGKELLQKNPSWNWKDGVLSAPRPWLVPFSSKPTDVWWMLQLPKEDTYEPFLKNRIFLTVIIAHHYFFHYWHTIA